MDIEIIFTFSFWIKFILISIIFVIAPVWLLDFFPLGFGRQLLFTLAGFVGVFIALTFGTLNPHRRRN